MKSGNLYGFHQPEDLPAGMVDKSIITENMHEQSANKDSLIRALSSEQAETAYDAAFHAFPNPFEKAIEIKYTLTETENVRIVVRDIYGTIVQILTEGVNSKGAHAISFDADQLQPGTYFCSIESASVRKTLKLVKTE
jgi:hypothetical protein